MSTMTAGERVHAAVKGETVDRVPFCFWHHFKPEGSGERLAEMTLEFFVQKFDLDIVKIMPDLPYPLPGKLNSADEIRSLPRLDLTEHNFHEQLVCIRALRERLGNDYPLILTLFSPFTTITRAMPKKAAIEQVRQHPDECKQGMATIAANLSDLMAAAVEAGASGIFFSCMGATSSDFTPEEYKSLIRPYDLQALEGAKNGWLNIVHVHADPAQEGEDIYFEDFVDYPVSVMSWSDRLTGPSLAEAGTMTNKCLMGGLWERGPLTHGSEMELENEILAAITETNGRHLILANGCSSPDDVDEQWLHIARRLVDNLK